MALEGSRVYTSDKKSAGRITWVGGRYFTSFRRGLMVDEEYRIPLDAIESPAADGRQAVRLALTREQLKHGYEIVQGEPNSELVSGRAQSELKIPSRKQVIHYEPAILLDENISIPPSTEGLPDRVEYSCDMCAQKFGDSAGLQEHRAKAHSGPTGI
jgi:hypothetical protein